MPQNGGKAEAVRQGVLAMAATGEYEALAYFDADFATPLDQIFLLEEALWEQPQRQMAFGSRVKLLGRVVERSAKRHYLGRVFATFASLILGLAVYDTQCGAKLIKRELALDVFAAPFMSRWLFDVEVFARIVRKWGHRQAEHLLVEVPLQVWLEKGGSKLGLKHMLRVPLELWNIRQAYFG